MNSLREWQEQTAMQFKLQNFPAYHKERYGEIPGRWELDKGPQVRKKARFYTRLVPRELALSSCVYQVNSEDGTTVLCVSPQPTSPAISEVSETISVNTSAIDEEKQLRSMAIESKKRREAMAFMQKMKENDLRKLALKSMQLHHQLQSKETQ